MDDRPTWIYSLFAALISIRFLQYLKAIMVPYGILTHIPILIRVKTVYVLYYWKLGRKCVQHIFDWSAGNIYILYIIYYICLILVINKKVGIFYWVGSKTVSANVRNCLTPLPPCQPPSIEGCTETWINGKKKE